MAITIPSINAAASADTFGVLYSRFNTIANAMSTQVVTTAANTTGGPTTGNAIVSGIFSATVLTTPTLRGGNVATPDVLNVVSNVVVGNNSSLTVGNSSVNSFVNSTFISVNTAQITTLNVATMTLGSSLGIGDATGSYFAFSTTNTSNQTIDSFLMANVRSAEYLIQITDTSGNNYQISKILVVHDGSTGYMTEYGIISSNSTLGILSVASNSTAVLLQIAPAAANNVIKATRTTIKV